MSASSRFETVARVLPAARPLTEGALLERLPELYALSQKSNYVFASPLGPFFENGRHHHLPRFVYFGPHTHDHSLRLAFLTGFEGTDSVPALALASLIERLIIAPEIGQGLNLSFFPLVDVLGRGADRRLASANWTRSSIPEINLLEKDARARGYHGFIRVETGAEEDTLRATLLDKGESASAGIELVSSEDFSPWPVRWEKEDGRTCIQEGPLTIVDDLPVRPFELRIALPKSWPKERQGEATLAILERFIARQRALQAYGQNL